MKRDEAGTYHILAIGDETAEFAELANLLRQRYVVRFAQSLSEVERASAQALCLIIAERHCLQQLNFEAVSAMIQDANALWILLDNETVSDDDDPSFFSRMYYVISAPYAPRVVSRLVARAIEHTQLLRKYESLSCASHTQAPESASPLQPSSANAIHDSLSSQQWGDARTSEKFAMLGQLLAGIIHEINTPSGAINAAVANLSHHLRTALESGQEMCKPGATLEQAQAMLRMFANMLNTLEEKPRRHSGEIRAEQKALAELLTQRNIPEAARCAREIARLGLAPWLDETLSLFRSSSGEHLLALLTSWYRIIHSAQDIKLSNEMLTRMVRAVKSYSYPWQEQLELADIQESLDIALTLLTNKFKHNIKLVTDFAELPAIFCNPADLTHVWLNLLHNAIQAIEGEGEVRVETFVAPSHIGVRVADTGKGISPDILPKIFAPNFTTKSREEGTGFGLYLVRQILDKHHGTIEVSSVPGHTVFEVRLPR